LSFSLALPITLKSSWIELDSHFLKIVIPSAAGNLFFPLSTNPRRY